MSMIWVSFASLPPSSAGVLAQATLFQHIFHGDLPQGFGSAPEPGSTSTLWAGRRGAVFKWCK